MSNILSWNEIQIFTFFYVFMRVSSLAFFVPLYGDKALPLNIKVLLAVAISWVCFPVLWNSGLRVAPEMYQHTAVIVTTLAQEIMLGVAIGFISRWVFDASMFAGQFVGNAMGLSMASILDPETETQTVPISEIKYIMALMLFLVADGHLVLLKIINQSFHVVPIGKMVWFAKSDQVIRYLIEMSAEILLLAVKIAAPVIIIVLIINLTFGLVSRAVPQMNVFVVSFGANILIGLFILIVTMPAFTNLISSSFEQYSEQILKFMEMLHG